VKQVESTKEENEKMNKSNEKLKKNCEQFQNELGDAQKQLVKLESEKKQVDEDLFNGEQVAVDSALKDLNEVQPSILN